MSNSKEGWLKIKLHNQTKWHRRYCIIDWDKSVLFIAKRADTRYRHWIKLLSNVIISDYDYSSNNEFNNNVSTNTIEIKADNGTAIHLLQAETKKDYENWLLALKQTAYSRIGGGIFGQSLEDTYKYSRDKSSLVPLIVRQCCEYLLEHGLTFVGLFRVPGKQSSIKELRDMYDRGLSVELKTSYSPATISSLLKTYLQSLPQPIIPIQYFDEFLEIGSRFKYNQTNDDLNRLKQLIEMNLSNITYAVLAYLCLVLKKITIHSQATKMDTDNLAVVFGNNLIRPVEEVDLQLIKGHNYNLLPLIKVLIDYSEDLFSNNNSTNQFHDSYEQTTESVTKSSGFSSFSSLLSSSNDHAITTNSRSSSMPSIRLATCSSLDSTDSSLESPSNIDNVKRRPKSFIEKQISLTSDNLDDPQSSLETNQINNKTFEDEVYIRRKSSMGQTRFASTDMLDMNKVQEKIKHNPRSVDNIVIDQEKNTDNKSRPISTIDVPIPIRKMEKFSSKKGFANKFGKSFSSLKSTMSKAIQSHILSNDNEPHTIDSSSPSLNQQYQRKSTDFQSEDNSLIKLQNDFDTLKELLNEKDLLIIELTKTSREERLKFEKEKFQLNQKIEQLHNENIKLQKQLNMK